MKKLFLTLAAVLTLSCVALADAPGTFKYQALVRGDDGSALADTGISLRIMIRQSSASGDIVYSETHSVTTSSLGVAYINIGEGDAGEMSLSALNWADGPYFLQVQADKGSGYVDLGTQQILSVPYARYAATAASVTLTSPSGKRFQVAIDDNGTLTTTEVE